MIYIKIFWSFFQIGLFSFGGGYASMPLIQNQIVDLHGWLSMKEFADVITVSQMTPGPIAINSATFVGLRVAGVLGAVVATAGCILPSCIIIMILSTLYYRYRGLSMIQGILKGLRPAVIALVLSAGLSLCQASFGLERQDLLRFYSIDYASIVIFTFALIGLRRYKANPIFIMLLSGLVGMLVFS